MHSHQCRSMVMALAIITLLLVVGCDPQVHLAGPAKPQKLEKELSYKQIKKETVTPVLNSPYWQKVKAGRLVISFTPDSPPFCVGKDAQIKGFNRALAEIIGLKLGIEVTFKTFPLKEQIPRLLKQRNRFDYGAVEPHFKTCRTSCFFPTVPLCDPGSTAATRFQLCAEKIGAP